jgi:hypothetical protein
MQIGPTSIFLSNLANHLNAIISKPPTAGERMFEKHMLHHWNFSSSSLVRSTSETCFLDYARNKGIERDGESFVEFQVCAYMGGGMITTSAFPEVNATLQNFSTFKGLKSRGWQRENMENLPMASFFGRIHATRDDGGILLYNECGTTMCNDIIMRFLSTKSGSSLKILPAIPSPTLLLWSLSEIPSFVGPTLQYQDGRLYVLGGVIRSKSPFIHQGRFTVATYDLNAEKSLVLMNLFVYQSFSAVVDGASASNGTHAFVFGGKIGWGRTESVILIISYMFMQVSKLHVTPTAPPSAAFSAVTWPFFVLSTQFQRSNAVLNIGGHDFS